jgi:exopolysaccharide biosynthesis polyprenyl glycosylphosphotransferase
MRALTATAITAFTDPCRRRDEAAGGEATADAVRRCRDIALSLVLLFVTLPLQLLVACLIKLESPGPVLFRQQRAGLRGKEFTVWKFRSMRADAEAAGPVWARRDDPRVTRVGAFIRAHRIDELPQLLNVLRGEMSLIGPRPERPIFMEQLVEIIPNFAARTAVPPGLTGWAQINYPYGASVEDARAKLEFDLYYIRNRSLGLDTRILLRTVGVVLCRTGAR